MGFVDAIETRDPDRQSMDEPERLLLNSLARVFARRWADDNQAVKKLKQQGESTLEQMADFNHSIINPLTGIIGSVELIRHKQPALSDESIKYLNLIERSANKIHEAALRTIGPGNQIHERTVLGQPPSIPGVAADSTVNRLQGDLETIRNWRLERSSVVTARVTPETVSNAR